MFPQGGVAIGMAMSIYQNLSHLGPEANEIGIMIVNVAVATIFIVQVISPFCLRFAIEKAKETGRDVTEEDIIESYRVSDLIDREAQIIRENTPLYSIIEMVKDSESYHFCVVDDNDCLLGIISLGDLRSVFHDQELDNNSLVLAKDIAVPATRVISSSKPLKEAIEIFRRKELDFLPIVGDESSKKLVGVMHYRFVMAEIHKKLVSRRGHL